MQVSVQEVLAPRTSTRAGFVERDTCPSCSSSRAETVWTGRFDEEPVRAFLVRHHYAGDPLGELAGESFRLVRCEDCSLLFHARVLDAAGLARLYGEWIDGAQIERFETERAHAGTSPDRYAHGVALFKHMLRIHRLAGGTRPLRLLDFGCGDGHALQVAASLGFEAHGIDPSRTRSERAERARVHVHATVEDALDAIEGLFDGVVMREVLEHLVAPRAALAEVVSALRPGGVLLVEVPDARGIAGAPATFEEMRVVHPLEHVNAFTPGTLESLVCGAGLVPAPRIPAHATTGLLDLVKTELSRFVGRPSTSRYFVKQ